MTRWSTSRCGRHLTAVSGSGALFYWARLYTAQLGSLQTRSTISEGYCVERLAPNRSLERVTAHLDAIAIDRRRPDS